MDTFFTNSFDFSACMRKFMPWFHQLGICMDYVERHLHGSLKVMNVFGLGARSSVFRDVLRNNVKRDVKVLEVSDLLSEFVHGEVEDAQTEFFLAIAAAVQQMLGGLDK